MIPMQAVLPAAAAGALIGLAVRAALPARRDLASALDRLDISKASTFLPSNAPTATGSLPERVGNRLLAEFGGRLTLPVKDLELLRISPAAHLGKRVLFALYGLLLPQLMQALLALAGAAFPFTLPALISLALAALFWFLPGREVARSAAAARLIVRHAAASYLERVALARIANSGAAQSLTRTAEVGDGWIFVRMRQVFHQADLAGVTVWDALKQLGDELDIPELTRPADTLALAGDGAAVYATLQAQARQLRIAMLSDAKATGERGVSGDGPARHVRRRPHARLRHDPPHFHHSRQLTRRNRPMNIEALTLLLKAHWGRLKTARDEGQGTTEVAVITAVVIVVAAGVALAIKTKVAEKVGIISGG